MLIMGLLSAIWIPSASLILLAIAAAFKHRTKLFLASQRRNCATPPLRPSRDPIFGIDILIQDLKDLKGNRLVKGRCADFRKYGKTYGFYLFGRRTIETIDPRNLQFVLSTENEKFGVGSLREEGSYPLIGRGVLTTDGEVWKKRRNEVMPIFTKSQIADREMFEKHFRGLLEKVEGREEMLDLKPLFEELALDAGSEFVFGESLNTLSTTGGSGDAKDFLHAFMYAQEIVGFRVLLGKLMFLIRDRKFWSSCDLVREYTKRQTERALHRETESTHGKAGRPKYHLVKELAKDVDDEEALHGQLLNVFLGGRDTPAVALGNMFFCLARHPSVWRKIREEVGDMRAEELTFEKLKSMRYLQYAINEGLRLYPPIPHLGRECLVETALPFGGGPDGKQPICVVPGDTVAWSTYALHRNPEAFGADVESFRPERWRDIRPGWNYIPFGGGARRCPAQQLALFWVSYAIARMAMEYQDIQSMDEVGEYVACLKLVMESFHGVKVRLEKAR